MLVQVKGTQLLFQRIHHAVGKGRMRGVSMVIAPNKDGQWKECHEPDEIFAALIKEYKAKYHQTENTPPMTLGIWVINKLVMKYLTENSLQFQVYICTRCDYFTS